DVRPNAQHPGNSSIPGRTRRHLSSRASCLELHSWARRAEHFAGAANWTAASCCNPAHSSTYRALCHDCRLGFLLADARRGGKGLVAEQDSSSTETAPRQLSLTSWYGTRRIRASREGFGWNRSQRGTSLGTIEQWRHFCRSGSRFLYRIPRQL